MKTLQMTVQQTETFASKLMRYPDECKRRAEADEDPCSLACWLGAVASPLFRAVAAEAAAFAGKPATAGDRLITFAATDDADPRLSRQVQTDDDPPPVTVAKNTISTWSTPAPTKTKTPWDFQGYEALKALA